MAVNEKMAVECLGRGPSRRRKRWAALRHGIVALGLLIGGPEGSGQSRRPEPALLGASMTLVAYRASGRAASSNPEPVRLTQTLDSLDAELTYLRKTLGRESLTPVHIRSVGLLPGERFRDGLLLAERPARPLEEQMEDLARSVLERTVEVVSISRTQARVRIVVTYRGQAVLRADHYEVGHFETILLEGGLPDPGQSGESQSVLMTLTVAILPAAQLRNRPREISAPCDEYGRPLDVSSEDVFLPPVLIERIVPKFPTRRAMGTILVEGIVTPEGRVTNARVLRTFDREMDPFALEAFQRFRFLPARWNGRPVRATIREEIFFQAVP